MPERIAFAFLSLLGGALAFLAVNRPQLLELIFTH
jgi:hypothetical protein